MSRRRDPAYCFGVGGVAKAPWRPELLQAQADAIDAAFAHWDEHACAPGAEPQIYMHPLAEIWTTYELVPAVPRDVSVPGAADQAVPLSRIDRIIARREGRKP